MFQDFVLTPQTLISRIYPCLIALAILEIFLIHRNRKSRFPWQEGATTLGVAVGHRLTRLLSEAGVLAVFSLAWQHRLMTIELDSPLKFLLLFFGIEFCYYWYHRTSHQVRWLWATHAVHHTPRHYNLSVAYRLGWTGLLSGNHLFFLPLCWLGFHPVAVVVGLALNLLYQYWLHTELIPKLGWLEWVFNTPSHHRVHHAANPEYIDRNYGGVLIIFDRLFGTFVAERPDVPPRYGLTTSFNSHNPFVVALHEWYLLFRDLFAARTWRDRFKVIAGSPANALTPPSFGRDLLAPSKQG